MISNFGKAKNAIPNMLTLFNGISGFTALLCATITLANPASADTYIPLSLTLIALAMVFDALDGRVARMTGSTSNIGAQLDSLCDAISFGVAPAFVMFFALLGSAPMALLWLVAVVYMSCAIYRLARFNVETTDHSEESHLWFSGLPSPAAAATVSLIIIAFLVLPVKASVAGPIAALLSLIPALLMVSRIRVPHLKQVSKMLKRRKE